MITKGTEKAGCKKIRYGHVSAYSIEEIFSTLCLLMSSADQFGPRSVPT